MTWSMCANKIYSRSSAGYAMLEQKDIYIREFLLMFLQSLHTAISHF